MSGLSLEDIDHVLAHTAPLWPDLARCHLLITGGTGFVGKWLLESFLAANQRFGLAARATILTRDANAFCAKFPHLADQGGLTFIEGDVRTFDLPQGPYSHVIHAATDMAGGEPLHVYDVIVEGTRHVLQLAADRTIENFLLISSGAVYGTQPATLSCIDEQYAGAPLTTLPHTAYGQGKRAAEWLTMSYAAKYGMPSRIARLFALSGPYLPLDANYALGNFVRDLLAEQPIRISGDGTPLRSYLYAADMAIWLWTILTKGETGAAYNVGSEEGISIADLAGRVARLGNGQEGIECGPSLFKAGAERYIPSTARARNELSLQQWISLDEGLRRMIAWNRSKGY